MHSMTNRTAMPETCSELHAPTVVVLLLLTLSILTAIALWPRGPFYILAVGPGPTQIELFDVLERAGGRFVAEGPTRWTAFVYSDASDFAARARVSGAFFTLQSPILSICREPS
ncbi:hypothetical protein C8J35_101804 [Rhizobium sp. PP-F2F-G38]|nr:hypothetical protein C8J37_101790 [Rhizobium sp. PP-WC-1G-195]PYF00981.1 hypothetical protein C8J35_101804 [Rhizobium sp. PP-F2F-G38]